MTKRNEQHGCSPARWCHQTVAVGPCDADGHLRDVGAGKGGHLTWIDLDPPVGDPRLAAKSLPRNNCAGLAQPRHLRVAEYASLFYPICCFSPPPKAVRR
jgi:hypothetical protein